MIIDLSHQLATVLPTLHRHAVRALAGRPGIGSAEDLVQDTVVTALQSIDSFDGTNLGGWLCTILDNRIRNAGRRAHLRYMVPMTISQDENGAFEHDAAVAPTQEVHLEYADLVNALGTLSPEDQTIIRLGCFEEWSYSEIADELGLPLGTVKSRLSRALARLRAAYEARPDHAREMAMAA